MKKTKEGGKTYRDEEKHIHLLIQILEPLRIVREPITRIRAGRVAEKYTLDLIWELGDHLRIGAHDVAVAGVGDEDELAVRESAEDFLQQEFADGEGGADVAEVERSRVEGATGVGLVDEVHVVARHLFGRSGEVVEVIIRYAAGPVGVDLRHVHPLCKGAGE